MASRAPCTSLSSATDADADADENGTVSTPSSELHSILLFVSSNDTRLRVNFRIWGQCMQCRVRQFFWAGLYVLVTGSINVAAPVSLP